MTTFAVIGLQWGDEGKGKVVDWLSPRMHAVIRFQGGNNAGHTLVLKQAKRVLHLIPSGILHPQCLCLLGPGVVIDPKVLLGEIAGLQGAGYLQNAEQLWISEKAHLIFPYHILLDQWREGRRGRQAIGTTGRGIGPCYEDKAARIGITMRDLLDLETFRDRLEWVLSEKNAILEKILQTPPIPFDLLFDEYRQYAEALRPYIRNTDQKIKELSAAGKNLLWEGAQGAGLDLDHGTYPYVTACSTLTGAVFAGGGLPFSKIDKVLGVAKAYTTRVGEGPFPTELKDAVGKRMQAQGAEFGATTGRPRRCGWLDLVWLRQACLWTGADAIALTKLDVLQGIAPLKVAIGYQKTGEPIYEEMEGFTEEIGNILRREDLPHPCQRYLKRIEEVVQIPVAFLSVGPERAQSISLQPF